MPTIFTNSPYESHIQAVFLKAQLALAQVMNGTPVFRVLLFWVLGWSIVFTFVKMASHHHRVGSGVVHIVYRIAMVFLAMGLLSWQNPNVRWSAPHGTAWGSMTGVNADTRYSSTLNTNTPGLWSFLMIYESLNGVGQVMVNATADAFGDPSLASDPTFLPRELTRMSAMALSPDTHRALDALNKQCADTTVGKIVGPTTSLKDLFDMDVTLPDGTKPCPALWDAFDANAQADATALTSEYPAYVWTKVNLSLSNSFGFADPAANARLALSNAILASERNQAGFTNYGRFWNSGNLSANDTATQSTGGDRLMEDQSQGLTKWFADMADAVANWGWGGNFQQASRKAEAANKFNMLAPLIPAARGMIQGVLSLLFVLAVYSVGFGTWRWMWAWIMAEATFCFYRPAAMIGFKAVEYFQKESQVAKSIGDLINQPYALGGALMMQDQLAELQTVYIMFEVGCFVVFTLGAIAAFKPLSTITSATGMALASQAKELGEKAITYAVGAAAGGGAGGGAGGPVMVSMNGGGGGGGGGSTNQVPVAVGDAGGAGNGTGIITPSAAPPQQWDNRAA